MCTDSRDLLAKHLSIEGTTCEHLIGRQERLQMLIDAEGVMQHIVLQTPDSIHPPDPCRGKGPTASREPCQWTSIVSLPQPAGNCCCCCCFQLEALQPLPPTTIAFPTPIHRNHSLSWDFQTPTGLLPTNKPSDKTKAATRRPSSYPQTNTYFRSPLLTTPPPPDKTKTKKQHTQWQNNNSTSSSRS